MRATRYNPGSKKTFISKDEYARVTSVDGSDNRLTVACRFRCDRDKHFP
ncbi:hypothetical protein ACPOL_0891 [Acidisarcina polymorpha]|uniref:Uncharacterized protein n=1 Tax=Acidisarcina polymorpha TaxID=2211140 RepID=A0A2Z5FTT2_9BACT|nr:hypothetical protein ACPOL_0891 [Acidisarcina polymorpha]